MSGSLFLLEVAAVVLIALWSWGGERPGGGWRVRLFDMRFQAEAGPSARSAPRWKHLRSRAETPPGDGQSPADFTKAPATPSSDRPKWRRSV
jgi:hypothetical protein